jgi:hypothetical protein
VFLVGIPQNVVGNRPRLFLKAIVFP